MFPVSAANQWDPVISLSFNSGPVCSDCVIVGYLVVPQKITVNIYKYLLTT